jgi:outer membrane protein OmpA-like peptidoglycan-associated protein
LRLKIHAIVLLLLVFNADLFSQQDNCPKSTNKKAVRYLQEASKAYKERRYDEAQKNASKAIEEDPEFADAYLIQGNVANKRKDASEFELNYKKVIELCPDLDPDIYYQLGWLYFDLKRWKESEEQLLKFLDYDRINEEHGKRAESMLAKAKLYAHPVPFNPIPVKDISTADPEYLAIISADNELAFFTRRFEMTSKNMLTPQSVEKFMIANLKSDGSYDKGKPLDDPFNRGVSNNEGGATISIDNKQLFFTVNTKGNFDICFSEYVDGKWGEIKNPGQAINDPRQWDSQPSLSADGKTLFFASARDSISGIDLYKSVKDESGNWKKAVKLSQVINTNGNDKSPFIHSDSRTLYFSSDSLPGLGGFDIFKIKMDENGGWTKPVNLGYPINTESDEVGFFVSLNGQKGYFASNKLNKGGVGGYDIYSFDLYKEAQPEKVYFQKGDINGPGNMDTIPATIEIKDAVTNKITKINVDSVSGEYAFVVNFENDLILSVKEEGYAFESKYISKKDSSNNSPVKSEIQLKKLEVGGQYTINDILFATNSYTLNDTIKTVLFEFSEYLNKNPKLNVSLQGHTDNVGNPDDNMVLSQNRAKAVADYLLSLNIATSRVSYKGFGETKPLVSNSTEEGRAMNRRTVFVVTSK